MEGLSQNFVNNPALDTRNEMKTGEEVLTGTMMDAYVQCDSVPDGPRRLLRPL